MCDALQTHDEHMMEVSSETEAGEPVKFLFTRLFLCPKQGTTMVEGYICTCIILQISLNPFGSNGGSKVCHLWQLTVWSGWRSSLKVAFMLLFVPFLIADLLCRITARSSLQKISEKEISPTSRLCSQHTFQCKPFSLGCVGRGIVTFGVTYHTRCC